MRKQEIFWYSPFEKLPESDSICLAKTEREGLILLNYNPYSDGKGIYSKPCFHYYDSAVDCEMEYPAEYIKEWAEVE